MSEGGEGRPKLPIKENNPKKEEVKPQETSGMPEKKLPLSKKFGAAIKYISASVSERKSQEVDDELTYISQEGVKPKTLKEHLEKEKEPKEFRFQLSGSKIPVEMLRAKELPEEMVLNVVLTGGAQAGVCNAEAMIKIMEMGLLDKKNLKVTFWGVSSGGANAGYLATGEGNAREGVKMYTEENLGYTLEKDGQKKPTGGQLVHLPDGKLEQIKFLLEADKSKPIVDTEYVADNVKSGKRKLDVEALKTSKFDVNVCLMDEEGKMKWMNLNKAPDPIEVIRAGINVPGVSRKDFIEIEGEKYADGAFAEGALLEEIFNTQGKEARVLIISNGSFGKGGQMEIVQKILGMNAKKKGENAYGYNDKVAELIEKHNEVAKTQGKQVWDEIVAGKNIALMELTRDSDFVPELEKDPEKLKKAGEKFAEFVGNTFDLEKELPLKATGLMSAGEELKAMDNSGKPPEIKSVKTEVDEKSGVEVTSGNVNAGNETGKQQEKSTESLTKRAKRFLSEKYSDLNNKLWWEIGIDMRDMNTRNLKDHFNNLKEIDWAEKAKELKDKPLDVVFLATLAGSAIGVAANTGNPELIKKIIAAESSIASNYIIYKSILAAKE